MSPVCPGPVTRVVRASFSNFQLGTFLSADTRVIAYACSTSTFADPHAYRIPCTKPPGPSHKHAIRIEEGRARNTPVSCTIYTILKNDLLMGTMSATPSLLKEKMYSNSFVYFFATSHRF